jgi:hypothetical protein
VQGVARFEGRASATSHRLWRYRSVNKHPEGISSAANFAQAYLLKTRPAYHSDIMTGDRPSTFRKNVATYGYRIAIADFAHPCNYSTAFRSFKVKPKFNGVITNH